MIYKETYEEVFTILTNSYLTLYNTRVESLCDIRTNISDKAYTIGSCIVNQADRAYIGLQLVS